MAELASYSSPGGVVGDTVGDKRIVEVLSSSEGRYRWVTIVSSDQTVITSAPTSNLVPGLYLLNASVGAFGVLLTHASQGRWEFVDINGSTALNPITIGSVSDYFNDMPGPLTFSGKQCLLLFGLPTTNKYAYVEL